MNNFKHPKFEFEKKQTQLVPNCPYYPITPYHPTRHFKFCKAPEEVKAEIAEKNFEIASNSLK